MRVTARLRILVLVNGGCESDIPILHACVYEEDEHDERGAYHDVCDKYA